MSILDDESLLQTTASRVSIAHGFAPPIVVGREELRFLIRSQLVECGCSPAVTILEPDGRNTAAAIALAAHWALECDVDTILVVAPSHHMIADSSVFNRAVDAAVIAARAGHLVTLGIKPDSPETGYGYIEIGPSLPLLEGVHAVSQFVEKPDATAATAFVASGNVAWNSGIFVFSAADYLQELSCYASDVAIACKAAMANAATEPNFLRPSPTDFLTSPNISIDYAVMEHTKKSAVVPIETSWSDLGSWNALWNIASRDDARNAIQGDAVTIDARNCLVRADDSHTVALIGVDDMIVVSTQDSVLVVPRSRSQEVQVIVEVLRSRKSSRHIAQPIVHRPWGTYQTTDIGDRFQTKRIVVKPGEQLSLQLHYHRSEHWVVVSGTAVVTIQDHEQIVRENESVYIPAGSKHRLANRGKLPLHLIEVQCGSYLGEDDIVRFEDSYFRT